MDLRAELLQDDVLVKNWAKRVITDFSLSEKDIEYCLQHCDIDYYKLHLLLSANVDYYQIGEAKNWPVWALIAFDGKVVDALDPTLRTRHGETPLHFLALSGNAGAVNDYIKTHKLDPNKSNRSGASALHFAARSGDPDTIELLIDEYKMDPARADIKGANALHCAVWSGSVKAAKLLINKYNLDPKQTDSKGTTCAHYAAKGCSIDMLTFLFDVHKMDFSMTDSEGKSVLHHAVTSGDVPTVRFLVEQYEMDVSQLDQHGVPMLHYAPNKPCLRYFLEECEVSVALKDTQGNSVLHVAAKHDDTASVRHLVEQYNLNPYEPNIAGVIPWYIASKYEAKETMTYLRSDFKKRARLLQGYEADGFSPEAARTLTKPELYPALPLLASTFFFKTSQLRQRYPYVKLGLWCQIFNYVLSAELTMYDYDRFTVMVIKPLMITQLMPFDRYLDANRSRANRMKQLITHAKDIKSVYKYLIKEQKSLLLADYIDGYHQTIGIWSRRAGFLQNKESNYSQVLTMLIAIEGLIQAVAAEKEKANKDLLIEIFQQDDTVKLWAAKSDKLKQAVATLTPNKLNAFRTKLRKVNVNDPDAKQCKVM